MLEYYLRGTQNHFLAYFSNPTHTINLTGSFEVASLSNLNLNTLKQEGHLSIIKILLLPQKEQNVSP
jgi:hypothetical protein